MSYLQHTDAPVSFVCVFIPWCIKMSMMKLRQLMTNILPRCYYICPTDWLESLLKETGEIEETDMTESIVLEAKEVAMDVLKGMRGAALTHASEAEELQAVFDAPL